MPGIRKRRTFTAAPMAAAVWIGQLDNPVPRFKRHGNRKIPCLASPEDVEQLQFSATDIHDVTFR